MAWQQEQGSLLESRGGWFLGLSALAREGGGWFLTHVAPFFTVAEPRCVESPPDWAGFSVRRRSCVLKATLCCSGRLPALRYPRGRAKPSEPHGV